GGGDGRPACQSSESCRGQSHVGSCAAKQGLGRAMRQLLETAKRASTRDSKVLITGETGVGKDVLGRYIHPSPPRRVASIRCGQLRRARPNARRIGAVRARQGSFTGPYRDKLESSSRRTAAPYSWTRSAR